MPSKSRWERSGKGHGFLDTGLSKLRLLLADRGDLTLLVALCYDDDGRYWRAGIAQLVEYKLPKLGVAGSNPVARSTA